MVVNKVSRYTVELSDEEYSVLKMALVHLRDNCSVLGSISLGSEVSFIDGSKKTLTQYNYDLLMQMCNNWE